MWVSVYQLRSGFSGSEDESRSCCLPSAMGFIVKLWTQRSLGTYFHPFAGVVKAGRERRALSRGHI